MKIPKQYAHLAVEATNRNLVDLREGRGSESTVKMEKAAGFALHQKDAMQAFFEVAERQQGLNATPGVQYEELAATAGLLHQELKAVDIDDNGIDDVERAQMSKAGQVAMSLAEQMMAQEPIAAMTSQQFEGLTPQEVVATVRQAATSHVELGYNVARAVMFVHLDNREGKVDGVYTGQQVDDVVGIPNSTLLNTEHTWPKSRGVKDTPAVSDLHHLFPTGKEVNTRRGTYPFGEVEQVTWEQGDAKLGYDKDGQMVFEPPAQHKGNIARALFYVATVYQLPLEKGEPSTLLQWNKEDPVDAHESRRNDEISRFQRNRNPFVDHPDLAEAFIASMSAQASEENSSLGG